MNDSAQVQQLAVEAMFGTQRMMYGQDFCDLLQTGTVTQGSGHTLGKSSLAENVECFVEEISGASANVNVGGNTVVTTHRITMKRSDEALALAVDGKIKVHARAPNAEMVFEQPIRPRESFSPLLEFKAILVTDGYRQGAS